MKILFVLDDVATENEKYSSVFLAYEMHNRRHQVFLTDVRGLAYYPDGHMGAKAYYGLKKEYPDQVSYINEIKQAIKEGNAKTELITSAELDVIFIRNDPSEAPKSEPWAQTTSVVFGQIATQDGVIVLNDPFTLSDSVNKMYFQQFPEEVRPKTLITRNPAEIKDFYQQNKKKGIVMKPLPGSGGKGVFLVKEKTEANLNSMIEANLRDGYIIVQEYLPAAADGDIRLFMMNGQILENGGKVAALLRFNDTGDVRNNLHAGGKVKQVEITPKVRELAEWVRPKLVQDGLFLVGLDIAGDKLMETNIFTPGGLTTISKMQEHNFAIDVIEAIERKVEYNRVYRKTLTNKMLNVL